MQTGGSAVIRQAIMCDICGNEKRQTNHWFVAYSQGGELRVSGWSSRNRLRPGSKHLCGQTCLHKLLDEFVAQGLGIQGAAGTIRKDGAEEPKIAADTSLISNAGFDEFESSARLVTTPLPIAPNRSLPRPAAELVAVPLKINPEVALEPVRAELPAYAPRNLRMEAWKRERERELRAGDRQAVEIGRRRSGS